MPGFLFAFVIFERFCSNPGFITPVFNSIMSRLKTHPGEVLREKYLLPPGLSARALAKELDVPPNRLTEIMRGTRDVTGVISVPIHANLQATHNLT